MSVTKLQTTIDLQLKQKAQTEFKNLGLDINEGVRLLLKQFTKGNIVVDVTSRKALEYKEYLDKGSREIEQAIKDGTAKGYTDVDELMNDLNN